MSLQRKQHASAPTLDEIRWLLEEFQFDRPEVERPYSVRLAEQTGWSREYTERVIREYRRFLYLAWDAVQNRTTAVPSVIIDQAWHLHLEDTVSYWSELCGNVLRCAIHHRPAETSEAEADLSEFFQQTHRNYLRFFGESPPADIWGDLSIKRQPRQLAHQSMMGNCDAGACGGSYV